MNERTQDFVVCRVTPVSGTRWDIALGPGENDPWVTVTLADLGMIPRVGGIVTLTLPRVVNYIAPKAAPGQEGEG